MGLIGFSRFHVYWVQTDRQTDKQSIYRCFHPGLTRTRLGFFSKNFAFFAFSLLAKNAKILAFFAKFRFNLFLEKRPKKYEREMSDYGKMSSSQSSELHKFFEQVIVAAMGFARTINLCELCEKYFCEISHSFCIFSLKSFSRKNANENFLIFCGSFLSLEI